MRFQPALLVLSVASLTAAAVIPAKLNNIRQADAVAAEETDSDLTATYKAWWKRAPTAQQADQAEETDADLTATYKAWWKRAPADEQLDDTDSDLTATYKAWWKRSSVPA